MIGAFACLLSEINVLTNKTWGAREIFLPMRYWVLGNRISSKTIRPDSVTWMRSVNLCPTLSRLSSPKKYLRLATFSPFLRNWNVRSSLKIRLSSKDSMSVRPMTSQPSFRPRYSVTVSFHRVFWAMEINCLIRLGWRSKKPPSALNSLRAAPPNHRWQSLEKRLDPVIIWMGGVTQPQKLAICLD